MQPLIKRLSIITVLASAISLIFSASVFAHVVVNPKEVLTSQRVTFAVSVPNESETSDIVGVRLVIPEGMTSVRPLAKAGWNIEVIRTGEGENVSAKEIIWTSVGETVPVNLKDDFLFGAKAPQDVADLRWNAYETYADGTVVGWDQEPSENEDNKPFSVTKVVSETVQETIVNQANQAASDAKDVANQALYVAAAGLAVGVVAVYLATRKK